MIPEEVSNWVMVKYRGEHVSLRQASAVLQPAFPGRGDSRGFAAQEDTFVSTVWLTSKRRDWLVYLRGSGHQRALGSVMMWERPIGFRARRCPLSMPVFLVKGEVLSVDVACHSPNPVRVAGASALVQLDVIEVVRRSRNV